MTGKCCLLHEAEKGSEFQLTWLSSFFLFYLVQSGNHRTGCVFLPTVNSFWKKKTLTDSPKGGHIKVLGVWYHNQVDSPKLTIIVAHC